MLRNRKHEEAKKLKGVDLVDEESDLELGQFTSLENFIPSDVYAIKKKRGTRPLNALGLRPIITETGNHPIITETGDDYLITEF